MSVQECYKQVLEEFKGNLRVFSHLYNTNEQELQKERDKGEVGDIRPYVLAKAYLGVQVNEYKKAISVLGRMCKEEEIFNSIIT